MRETSLSFLKLSMEELQVSVPLSFSEIVIYQESMSVIELVKPFLHMKTSLYPAPLDIDILTSRRFNSLCYA